MAAGAESPGHAEDIVEQLIERRTEGLAPIGQTVFDLRGYLVMDDPANNAVALQLPQLLDQHPLGDRRDGPLELRETQ